MVRILGYLIAVAALVGGAVWLADHPGEVTVRWLAWQVDTSVPVTILGVLAIACVAYVLLRFLAGFLGLPGRFARSRRERRQTKGTAALAGAVTALAGGDAGTARRCIKDTDKTLANPQLTHLLAAGADRAEGDLESARGHYEALLETPETELAGLRGLIEILPPDDPRVPELARRAYARAPQSPWAAEAAYAAELAAGNLEAAQAILDKARKKGVFATAEAETRTASIAMARAEAARGEGRLADAAKLARQALDLAPDDTAAALALARIHLAEGRDKKAAEVLEQQWRAAPSAVLLRAYLDLWTGEDATARAKRVRQLVADNPEHPESRFALAEALMRAEAYPEARAALAPLAGPSAPAAVNGRAALTMARILAAEGADAAQQREWIERAAVALAE